MKRSDAIEVIRIYKEGNVTVAHEKLMEAIDTVVAELEKPLPTDEQIKKSITEAVEKEKECIRQFLIDDGYELLADKI